MVRRTLITAIVAAACGGGPATVPMYPAGSDKDDGHGLLARASARLLAAGSESDAWTQRRRGADGGAGYGRSTYGGGRYGGFVVPSWTPPPPNRTPTHQEKPGLTGAIEGTVRWRGARPDAVASSCGSIVPIRVGAGRVDRGISGVLVYIMDVRAGRILPHHSAEQRPSNVGGVMIKRGCALLPTVQVVTPIPASLTIHGDAKETKLRATLPLTSEGEPTLEGALERGGRFVVPIAKGVTRIDAVGGEIGSAWVVGTDSPAYAITTDDGQFRIDELAAGTYEVTVFQPPIPSVKNGAFVYGPPVVSRHRVTVGSGSTRLDVLLGR